MRAGATVTALTLISVFGLQVLLLWSLLNPGSRSFVKEAQRREELLDQQLQRLENSTVHLKDLHLRLTELEEHEPVRASTVFHSDALSGATGGAAKQDEGNQKLENVSQQGLDSQQGEGLRLADLADILRSRKPVEVEVAIGGTENVEHATRDSDGEVLIFPSGNEDGQCVGGVQKASQAAFAAVVTVTFDRADYLKRHLDSLLAVHGRHPANKSKFPLHVSQDGKVPERSVANLATSLGGKGVRYLHHEEREPPKRLLNARENLAYYRIANHYKFILRTFFDCFGYSRLIILEDDMELAPDFFGYFEAAGSLLSADASLFCVSSWNDHGQAQFVRDETRLYRSEFFPGLGWMLSKDLWLEVSGYQGFRGGLCRDEWPAAYWDDWVRLNKVRRGRQCIRPEVCRTYNFGARGSSKGFYYKRFLAPIRLSTAELNWSNMDLSYLRQPRYDADLNASLAAAQAVTTVDEIKGMSGDVVLRYHSQEHYETLTGRLGMLREWKDGVPRAGYKGVVTVNWNRVRVFIAPSASFVQPQEVSGAAIRVDSTGAVVRKQMRGRKFGTQRR